MVVLVAISSAICGGIGTAEIILVKVESEVRPRKQFQYPCVWQERQNLMNWSMIGCPSHLSFI